MMWLMYHARKSTGTETVADNKEQVRFSTHELSMLSELLLGNRTAQQKKLDQNIAATIEEHAA